MAECARYEELISCLLDGELSPAEAQELQQHMAHCAECRQTYATYTALFAPAVHDDPPGSLLSGIMEEAAHTAPVRRRRPHTGWIAAAACAALILMALPSVFGSSFFSESAADSATESVMEDTTEESTMDSDSYDMVTDDNFSSDNKFTDSADSAESPAQTITGCTVVRKNDDGSVAAVCENESPFFASGQEFVLAFDDPSEAAAADRPEGAAPFAFTYKSVEEHTDGTVVFSGCRIVQTP